MKKIIGALLCLALVALCAFALAVEIDEAHFPDAAFRTYAMTFDTDGDGTLSESEIAEVKVVALGGKEVASLKGIEYFTALEELYCFECGISELDVSHNAALTDLHCDDNQLTALDLSHNPELSVLGCMNNQLIMLDLSHNPKLKWFRCSNNRLTALDLSHNPLLDTFDCNSAGLSALDLSANVNLEWLSCADNWLSSLDLSHNPKLEQLYCYENRLTALELGSCPELHHLDCRKNQLTTLNISGNQKLDYVTCDENRLASLDAGNLPLLQRLWCDKNLLTSLNVANDPVLEELRCDQNRFTELDVSNCTLLCKSMKENGRTPSGYGPDKFGSGFTVDWNVTVTGETVSKPKARKINEAYSDPIPGQVYTGKALRPELILMCSGMTLERGRDYIMSYKDNKKIGTGRIIVTGRGLFSGEMTVYFTIIPKAVKLSSLKAGSREMTVAWKKGKGIDGYEIQYSLKESMSGAKTVAVEDPSTVKRKISSLKSKKKYYVRVRTYKKVRDEYYFSEWSAVKSVKVK